MDKQAKETDMTDKEQPQPESEAISKKHFEDLVLKIEESDKVNAAQHKVLTDTGEHVKRKQEEQKKLLLALSERIEPILKNREDLDAVSRVTARIIRPIFVLVISLGAIAAAFKSIQWILDAVRHWK